MKRIAIGGVGLLGGSLGLRLRALPQPPQVIGFGRREESLKRAVERGAIDRYCLDAAKAVEGADVIVLAAPVMTIPEMMSSIANAVEGGAIVTDVGSTKSWIAMEAKRRLKPSTRFVGSHPMAGSEKSGIESADATLFEQAVVVVTPTEMSDEEAVLAVSCLWESVGAVAVSIPPLMHDRMVASVSHLPHIVASALVNTAALRARRDPATWDLAAGGFRDTTRIASSLPDIWRDICLTNREQILSAMEDLRTELFALEEALERRDGAKIRDIFAEAARSRETITAKGKGLLPGLFDLFVELADRPGGIAEATGVLGSTGINIVDIEITRMRDSKGIAPLRLFFASESDRAAARESLSSRGFAVRIPG